MQPDNSDNHPLAVLIDADNVSASIVEGLLTEIAKLGIASVKRIYGDWTTPGLTQWKSVLLEHSIQPIQQFAYTTGKNATDSALIIDAMDLLYAGVFSGFCLVSSDSDFTRLAARIRESGLKVYGFGERKTPRPFVAACDRFTYTEVFANFAAQGEEQGVHSRTSNELRGDARLVNLLRAAIDAECDDSGWTALARVGSYVNRTAADFDPRNYGFAKLSDLVRAVGLFELERKGTNYHIRDLRKVSTPRSNNTVQPIGEDAGG